MRWRLYVEEYSPELLYVPGEDNQAADALSRLPMLESDQDNTQLSMEVCAELFASQHDTNNNPLSYAELAKEQSADKKIKALLAIPNHELKPKVFHGGRM